MLLIMEAAPLFIKMKMIFTWRSHARAFWHITHTEMGSIPVLSPLTDPIMLKITLQIQWSAERPLGINWVNGKGNLYILQTEMQLESSCCLSSKLDVPSQGQDPSVSKTSQTSGNHLSTRGYPDQQLVLYAHFYRLLGHCQWSGHLVWPMATTIPIQGCLFRVKSSGNLLSHRYPKYQSRSRVFHVFNVTIQGLRRALLILFRVPDITNNKQDIHFTSQNTQCWARKQNIQQNVHLAHQESY